MEDDDNSKNKQKLRTDRIHIVNESNDSSPSKNQKSTIEEISPVPDKPPNTIKPQRTLSDMYYNSPTSTDDKEQRILKNLTEIGSSPKMLKKKSKYYNDGKGEDDSIFKRKPRHRSVSKSSEFDIKFHEIPLEREDKTMKEKDLIS